MSHRKHKGSALAMALIFSFVGLLLTVSYLEYLQIASRQVATHAKSQYAELIARYGLQMHFHKLQRMFFKYAQSFTEGEVMGGQYQVISRSYYELGMRQVQILSIGSHETRKERKKRKKQKAAFEKVLSVTTPTDYVRFFDGNYMRQIAVVERYQQIHDGPSLFWLGPVHSNGSISLGVYDSGYPNKPAGDTSTFPDDTDYNINFGGAHRNHYPRLYPNLSVNHNQFRYKPGKWGLLGFVVKDKSLEGPVISTAGYFFIPVNFPQGDSGGWEYVPTTQNDASFAAPLLIGEVDDPYVIVDIQDETYPVTSDNQKSGRFGLYNDIPRRSGTPNGNQYYNLVNLSTTETLARGNSELVEAHAGGLGLKFYPYQRIYPTTRYTGVEVGFFSNEQVWGNAYEVAEHSATRNRIYGHLEEFMYPLDDYRDAMPEARLKTGNTPEGLLRMATSEGFLIKIPSIRKKIGGVDYANMPFKSISHWRDQLRRFYRPYVDPRYDYDSTSGKSMVLINHASREKMVCDNDAVPEVYEKIQGTILERATDYSSTSDWPLYKKTYKNYSGSIGASEIARYPIIGGSNLKGYARNGELPLRLRHISRVSRAPGQGGLWDDEDFLIANLYMSDQGTHNVPFFMYSYGGKEYGSMPTCDVSQQFCDTDFRWKRDYEHASKYATARRGGWKLPSSTSAPTLQFQDPSALEEGWVYVEFVTDFICGGLGLNFDSDMTPPAYPAAGNYSTDQSYEVGTDFVRYDPGGLCVFGTRPLSDTSDFPVYPNSRAMFSTENMPENPGTGFTPHTNTGIFMGRQTAKDIGRWYRATKHDNIMTLLQQGSQEVAPGQCGFQLPTDIFTFHKTDGSDGGREVGLNAVKRIFVNIKDPLALKNYEAMYMAGVEQIPLGSTNFMDNSQVIQKSGSDNSAKAVEIIRVFDSYKGVSLLISNFGAQAQDKLWINPWFRMYFVQSRKDVGTVTKNQYGNELSPTYGDGPLGKPSDYGVNYYNTFAQIAGPMNYHYRITAAKKIIPTWDNVYNWQSSYQDKMEVQKYIQSSKWYAPLAETVRILDLSTISTASFPRTPMERDEPGVIYSSVPLLVYGNPKVPVTIVCAKNIYLKSINGYFPADNNGEPVKEMGQSEHPSVGIVSAEAVWVVPLSERKNDYGPPGGPRDIILNNVAIWTTKGFFNTMGPNPKMVLSGSVITMSSHFGKTYYPSYQNIGESYYGIGGTRTGISGLGATDICLRVNQGEGNMSMKRESFQYTKMFRGDDLETTTVLEGPPPHFPVYFQRLRDGQSSLERAGTVMKYLKPYIENRKLIPEGILREMEDELGKSR